jgi:succinoglycan biosynthesis transport protein ExoP
MSTDYQPADDDVRMDAGGLLRAVVARLPRIALVTVLLLAATFAILMFVPKTYESSASLLVEARDSSYTRSAGDTGASSGSAVTAEALISSQIELIKSRDLLLEVVDSQKLRSVPEFSGTGFNPVNTVLALMGRKPEARSLDETVLANLSVRMTVIRERDSAVISVFVRSTDPELAASIANAVAEAHLSRRAAQSVADTTDAKIWLQGEIDKLRTKVNAADKRVADYKVENGLFVGSNATPVTDQALSTVTQQITDAQQRKNDALSRAELIRGLVKSGQPLDGVSDVRNSVVISSLLQTSANLQAELAQRSTTLLNGHPTIKALRAQVAELDSQIRAESRKVADSLEAEAMVQADLEQKLRDELTRAQVASGDATQGGVTLDGLQREAKAQRDLLETYLARFNDAEARSVATSTLPDVRIVTEAAASAVPSSPKTALILGAVGFVALVLQVGAVLFGELMSGRALVERQVYAAVEEAVFSEAADAEGAIEPIAMPKPNGSPRDDLGRLSEAVSGRQLRTMLLANVGERDEAMLVIDRLVEDALRAGLSCVVVDAGSGDISPAQGLSDLAAERCDYGDVVQRAAEDLAEISWGRLATIDRRSARPATLVEALADIYHVVIVDTGRVGMMSSLPLFADLRSGVVLVASDIASVQSVVAVKADIKALGLEVGRVVTLPTERVAAVA